MLRFGLTFGGENARGVPGTLEQGHPEVLGNVLGSGGLVLLHTTNGSTSR
jgi:hypothetical protein